MNIETFRVPSSSGTDLACVRFGEGPPLLLAHPLVFSKAYFAAAAPVFESALFYTVDLSDLTLRYSR